MGKLSKKLGLLLGVALTLGLVVWFGNLFKSPYAWSMSAFDFQKHITENMRQLKQFANFASCRDFYYSIRGEIQTEKFAGAINKAVADNLYKQAYDVYAPMFTAYAETILADTVWADSDINEIYNEASTLGGPNPDVSQIKSTIETYKAVLNVIAKAASCSSHDTAMEVKASAAKYNNAKLPIATRNQLKTAPDSAWQRAYNHILALCDQLIASQAQYEFAADFQEKAAPIIAEAEKFNDQVLKNKIATINNIIYKKTYGIKI